MDVDSQWLPFARVERRVPPALRSWLVEPGLLTARIRALCGDRMQFHMLGPLREAELPDELRERLDVRDPGCLLREVEFRCGPARIVYAQTVLPDSTLEAFPWLRELGDSPIGESLRRAGEPFGREPLECACLSADSGLARAARAGGAAAAIDSDGLWARRAVYRLDDRPILVQEVFLPSLLHLPGTDEAASART